jgi:hypothetical protein
MDAQNLIFPAWSRISDYSIMEAGSGESEAGRGRCSGLSKIGMA